MLPAYFISDLHLGCDHPRAAQNYEQRAVALLNSWQGKASHVVLVGDSFEFWMEYKHYISFDHWPFLEALSALVKSGVQVHLLAGNHDFAVGDFFNQVLGVHVHQKLVLELQGKRLLFLHGDGLAKSDGAYRFARKIVDLPINRFLFKLIHPDWGYALARFVGKASRKANEHKKLPVEEYASECRRLLREHKADFVVHGHYHYDGGVMAHEEGVQINCGNWLFDLNYVEFNEGQAVLRSNA